MGGPCLGQVSGTAMHFPARSGVLHCPAGYRQACPAGHWRLPIPPQVWPVWAVAAPAARIRASPSSVNGSVLDLMTNLLVYRECAAAVAGPYFRECKFHPIGAMPPAFGAARSRPEDFRTALGGSKWLRSFRNDSETPGAHPRISERLPTARSGSEGFKTTFSGSKRFRSLQNDFQRLGAAPKPWERSGLPFCQFPQLGAGGVFSQREAQQGGRAVRVFESPQGLDRLGVRAGRGTRLYHLPQGWPHISGTAADGEEDGQVRVGTDVLGEALDLLHERGFGSPRVSEIRQDLAADQGQPADQIGVLRFAAGVDVRRFGGGLQGLLISPPRVEHLGQGDHGAQPE